MQSKSQVLFLLLIIAIPVIALSSNHKIFFTIASLIILFISVRNIIRQITGTSLEENGPDEEVESELEELIDIDIKRFGTGISVIGNLLVILFLIYSAFFIQAFILKIICSLAILLQIHFILKKTANHEVPFIPDHNRIKILLSSLLNIAVIIFTLLNKLSKLS